MSGITHEDLYDFLANNHEVEFSYHGGIYSIEPTSDNGIRFEIWRCDDNAEVICSGKADIGETVKEILDNLFSEKCFSGKSFFDIEDDVIVDTVF